MQDNKLKKVFRSFALSIATFDYLKSFQRKYNNKHKELINNNQALAMILSEHQQSTGGNSDGC